MTFNTASTLLDGHHYPDPMTDGGWLRCRACGYPCAKIDGSWVHRAQPILLAAVRANWGPESAPPAAQAG